MLQKNIYVQKMTVKSSHKLTQPTKYAAGIWIILRNLRIWAEKSGDWVRQSPQISPKANWERILIYSFCAKGGWGGDFSGKQLPLYSVLKQG
jgi:hypothetical protein